MFNPHRCYASETNYYEHARGKDGMPPAPPSVSGKTQCPKCGKPIKLRTGRMGAQQLHQIPTHNRPKVNL